MKKQSKHSLLWLFLGWVMCLSAMSGGCAAKPEPIALEHARTAYHQAAEDQALVQHAPGALRDAEQVLHRAEQTWQAERNIAEVEHLAYLTEQRVAIARARADNKEAEADWRRLAEEREQVLREARIQEVEQARREAEEARARHAEATKQLMLLQEQLGALQAKATSRGAVLTLGSVLFEPGKATLRAEALHNVYPLVTFMREDARRTAIIEGYTDNVGSEKSNIGLSQRRAEAVREFLITNGIDGERIEARGYGEAAPVAPNDTEAGRQQNRRVEVVFPQ
jgi:outer membrane protein OmpA-like peptidoglycan-associated protein